MGVHFYLARMNSMSDYTRIDQLKDENDKLKREIWGWKQSAKREGIYGFALGAFIFFWVGFLAASLI